MQAHTKIGLPIKRYDPTVIIRCPRLTIAGLGGDTGKTVISVGLCRVWQKKGLKVIPLKKGPDYIDMGWLSLGASHSCYNLDLFLMDKDKVLSSFYIHTQHADIALIEGNRGLYDGLDQEGSVSTAELSKLLKSPVVIIVDCTKVTRTVAALVLGCQRLDPDVHIKGVILNRLANLRQETVIRKSIEHYCHLPVVGAIPRLKNITFPGRHLGLVPPQEHPMAQNAINNAAEMVEKYLDLEALWEIAKKASPLEVTPPPTPPPRGGRAKEGVRIGIIRDSAFQFYYPENIEALKRAGAEILEFSALTDDLPPSIDAIYIGGGFPETHAAALSANERLRQSIKKAAEEGLPIYAECGGLMYLGEKLIWEGKDYPMVGVFPIAVGLSKKPQGHGYSIIEVDAPNPFFRSGLILLGHEFHYSYVINVDEIFRLTKDNENNPPESSLVPLPKADKRDNPPSPPFSKGGKGGLFIKGGKGGFEKIRQGGFSKQKDDVYFAFKMKKGRGIVDNMDGLCYKNVLVTYTHLHALSTREWEEGIMNKAMSHKEHGQSKKAIKEKA
jgi:cobyrinic acid a,c-diamide synthase